VKRRPFCQLIQATVFHPFLRLISRTIRHPVSVRFTARSSLPSSVKRTGGRRDQFAGCPGDKVRVGSSVGYGMTQDQRWGMLTSSPPLILGSSHAFLKNAYNQPSESISLSEKNYPQSYPLTIPNPWRGLSKDEHTTRCVPVGPFKGT